MDNNKWMWIMSGLSFISLCFMVAWVNTPTTFSTFHNVYVDSDNETKSMFEAIARIKEAEDQQCIVKEYETIIVDKEILFRGLINESLIENCSYTNE